MPIVPPNPIRIDDLTGRIRSVISDTLRDRVAGPDAEAKAAALREAPGVPMHGPDSAVHKVHSDASMFIGGMRALLLQSLHPLAMAGVAQHSDYRTDPWGRLQRTADFVAATTFGTEDVARAAVARVKAVHTRVRGVTRDGRAYSANDPHLLTWVHVAEVDSFLAAHDAYGAEPLSPGDRDAYVAGMATVASELGVPDPPRTAAQLRDRIASYRPELASTPESRDAARYLLLTPPLSLPARVPYGMIAAAAVATLPVWTRPMLRLPWLPLTERFVVRRTGRAIAGTIRWAIAGDELYSAAS
jgi:uncharacterized protein (DUF2236 family)